MSSKRGLPGAIVAIELSYGRGRTELVRPQGDGVVTLAVGRGPLRSIAVRYVNRGGARDATIQVLGKGESPAIVGWRGQEPPMPGGNQHGPLGSDGFGRGGR